ncbi:hypothetical protein TNCV_5056241 [Trichonephila clavipes]|nr:hypothetical protein TNCV_5056241 [Trichonephila clavipes]
MNRTTTELMMKRAILEYFQDDEIKNMYATLVESMPRRVEKVISAKGRHASFYYTEVLVYLRCVMRKGDKKGKSMYAKDHTGQSKELGYAIRIETPRGPPTMSVGRRKKWFVSRRLQNTQFAAGRPGLEVHRPCQWGVGRNGSTSPSRPFRMPCPWAQRRPDPGPQGSAGSGKPHRKNVPEISSFLDSRVEMNQLRYIGKRKFSNGIFGEKLKKQDLVLLAEELGQKVSDKMTNIELRNIIIGSKDYEEEFVRDQLSVILEERFERESEEKIARQLAIEEEKIARQHAIQQLRWESELNELRLEIESIRSNVKRTSCAEDRKKTSSNYRISIGRAEEHVRETSPAVLMAEATIPVTTPIKEEKGMDDLRVVYVKVKGEQEMVNAVIDTGAQMPVVRPDVVEGQSINNRGSIQITSAFGEHGMVCSQEVVTDLLPETQSLLNVPNGDLVAVKINGSNVQTNGQGIKESKGEVVLTCGFKKGILYSTRRGCPSGQTIGRLNKTCKNAVPCKNLVSLGRDRRFGNNFANELQFIPLSNDTIARRDEDIVEDVEQQPFEWRRVVSEYVPMVPVQCLEDLQGLVKQKNSTMHLDTLHDPHRSSDFQRNESCRRQL